TEALNRTQSSLAWPPLCSKERGGRRGREEGEEGDDQWMSNFFTAEVQHIVQTGGDVARWVRFFRHCARRRPMVQPLCFRQPITSSNSCGRMVIADDAEEPRWNINKNSQHKGSNFRVALLMCILEIGVIGAARLIRGEGKGGFVWWEGGE
ncbi:hypothetical protein Taro_014686, partial [Colocasia esculenta]|nr:hypothetical protein [Colocasia esculenta]